MDWLAAAERLRGERRAAVLVTVSEVRGHAPRDAGAKMVVALPDQGVAGSARAIPESWGSVGGGNLEETALHRAGELLAGPPGPPELLTVRLSDRAPTEHGRQCCGGEVTLLFEHLPVRPAVAVFGAGHVGLELARILSRQPLELHLVDSRADRVRPAGLAFLDDGPATLHVHHAPLPEVALGELPSGTHVLVMTHDHAEDLAICDAALRCEHLASIGLIGSSAKWRRFRQALAVEGHPATAVERIRCPVGSPQLVGKDPPTIALGIAVELLARLAPTGALSA